MVHETQWLAINDLGIWVSITYLYVCCFLCLGSRNGMVIGSQASFLLLSILIEWSDRRMGWRGGWITGKEPLCELTKNCQSQVFSQLMLYTMKKIFAWVRSLWVTSKQDIKAEKIWKAISSIIESSCFNAFVRERGPNRTKQYVQGLWGGTSIDARNVWRVFIRPPVLPSCCKQESPFFYFFFPCCCLCRLRDFNNNETTHLDQSDWDAKGENT